MAIYVYINIYIHICREIFYLLNDCFSSSLQQSLQQSLAPGSLAPVSTPLLPARLYISQTRTKKRTSFRKKELKNGRLYLKRPF